MNPLFGPNEAMTLALQTYAKTGTSSDRPTS